MSLASQNNIIENEAVRNRMRIALTKKALTEAAGANGPRKNLGIQVLANPEAQLSRVLLAVAAQETAFGTVVGAADSKYSDALEAVWDALAAVQS